LFCNETLHQFSKRLRRKQYQLFVEEGVDKEIDTFYKKVQRIPILGTEAFTKTISEKYLAERRVDEEVAEHREIVRCQRLGIEAIFQIVAEYYELEVAQLKTILHRQRNIPRSVAIYLAIVEGHASLNEVASFFGGIGYSAVAQSFRRFCMHLNEDNKTARILKTLTLRLMG
jgi:chromosomal replication initiation ATPase DnaA